MILGGTEIVNVHHFKGGIQRLQCLMGKGYGRVFMSTRPVVIGLQKIVHLAQESRQQWLPGHGNAHLPVTTEGIQTWSTFLRGAITLGQNSLSQPPLPFDAVCVQWGSNEKYREDGIGRAQSLLHRKRTFVVKRLKQTMH